MTDKRVLPTIVAELSANIAGGGLQRALETVDAAAKAGADAIKLQTWTPGSMVLDQTYRIQKGAWAGRKLAELYREAQTPWEWHRPLFDRAREHGMQAWSTPFDISALKFLESLDCPRYKIASFEILDLDLIRACAATGKPIIISTGMAGLEEIADARYAAGITRRVTLLQCTSAYPADASEANLLAMTDMRRYLNADVGLSDHTMGNGVACAATTLGATMIEKHFTLSRLDGGPDAHFSLEPPEFARLVKDCRDAKAALGDVRYGPTAGESTELRRGIYWAQDLPADHIVDASNMVTARPSTATTPAQARALIGCKLKIAVRRGEPVNPEAL